MIKEEMGRQRGSEDTFRAVAILLLFTSALALVSFGESLYGGFISLFLSESGIPPEEIVFFFTVFFAAGALIAILAGYISDRLGRNSIVIFLCALVVAVFSYTLADTRGELLSLRAVHGAVAASIFLIARAYIMDKTTKKNRGLFMGLFIFFTSIAGMVAPTFGGLQRDDTGSFYPLFYTAAIFSVIAVVLLLAVFKITRKESPLQEMGFSTKEVSNYRIFAVILVMFAMLYFASGILMPIMPLFATRELGMNYTQLGFLSSLMGIIFAFSQLAGGILSDFFGRKNLLVYPLVLYVVGIIIAGLSHTSWTFFGAYILVGIGAAPSATVAYSLIGDVVRQERRGVAVGVVAMLSGAVYLVGPWVGSVIGGIVGLQIPFFVCGSVVILTIVMLSVMLPRDRK